MGIVHAAIPLLGGFFNGDSSPRYFLANGVAYKLAAIRVQANHGIVQQRDEGLRKPDENLPGPVFCNCTTFHILRYID